MKTTSLIYLVVCVYYVAADFKLGLVKDDIRTRIIGGQDAVEGQFPYQVSFRGKQTNQHYCGGSILNNRFLLTAAHCLKGGHGDAHHIYAVVGTINRLESGIVVGIAEITVHDDYDPHWLVNDICLMQTSEEIIFTDRIQPIALPTQNVQEEGNVIAIQSGWGTISRDENILADILQFLKPRVLSNEECAQIFKENKNNVPLRATNICTINTKGVGGCFGDSGGPLVDITNPENKTLIGLVSFGVTCARGLPEGFTRIYPYLDWIQERIQETK